MVSGTATAEAATDRLADVGPGDWTPGHDDLRQRLTQGRGRFPGPFRVWQHNLGIANGMEAIGTFLDNHGSLSKAESEVLILSVAAYWQAPYVVTNHVRHSRAAGLSEEAIATICAERKPRFDDARLQLVADFVWTALDRQDLDDDAFAATEAAFGRNGIAEMLAAIGYYTAVAIAMRFHAVEPTAKSTFLPDGAAATETLR